MIEVMRKALVGERLTISPDKYHEWKHHDVTQALFQTLVLTILEATEESLPVDDTGALLSFKQDGAREIVFDILNWKPETVEADDD